MDLQARFSRRGITERPYAAERKIEKKFKKEKLGTA
jgi:hypothetical protein